MRLLVKKGNHFNFLWQAERGLGGGTKENVVLQTLKNLKNYQVLKNINRGGTYKNTKNFKV